MAKGKQTQKPYRPGKPGTSSGAAKPTGQGAGAMPPLPPKRAQAGGASTTPVATRVAQRQAPPPRKYDRRPWWQRNWATIATFVTIIVLIAIFVVLAHNATGGSSTNGQAVPATVLQEVTHVSPEVSAAVGTGGLKSIFQAVKPPAAVLKDASGKPRIIYIGAEYCPFCAAQRWSVIVALSRFGSFSNLHYASSSGTDVYPNTPTFTFYKSSYTSQYIAFTGVEYQDRNHNDLQPLTNENQQMLAKLDAPPYTTADAAGGIPFINFADQYVTTSGGYLPKSLENQTQAEIAKALSDSTARSTQDIVGNANYLTAAICRVIDDSAPACKVAPIPVIEQQLPKNG